MDVLDDGAGGVEVMFTAGRLSILAPVLLACGPNSLSCVLHGFRRKG